MGTQINARMTEEPATSYSDSDELPAKKAKYIWQIKGHYHLKKEENKPVQNDDELLQLKAVKWHNQQVAKAVFDNTVNSVIENMGLPLPGVENMMDNYGNTPNNGNVEDEAVQMAIRSHGLQKPCSCPDLNFQPFPSVPFHQRPQFDSIGASTSSEYRLLKEERSEFEHDFLSEAVGVAIQKKGLGAFSQIGSSR